MTVTSVRKKKMELSLRASGSPFTSEEIKFARSASSQRAERPAEEAEP